MKTNSKFSKLFKALNFAVKGIIYALKNERNMRIHTTITFYVLLFSYFCGMKAYEYAIIILTIGLVIAGEMFNSAIENLIDLCSKEYNSTAKAAKDIAAGAVLVLASAAAAVGFMLFGRKEAYTKLWAFFCCYPLAVVFLILSGFLSYIYIFWGPAEIKTKARNLYYKLKKKFENSNIINDTDGKSNEK